MLAGRLVCVNLYKLPACANITTVKLYFRGLGGSHPVAFFLTVACGLLLTDLLNTFQTWYLGYWASQYDTHDSSEVDVF